ncbi:MAG: hypothetical protein AAFN93_20825 [Bacteroidota bacterium]
MLEKLQSCVIRFLNTTSSLPNDQLLVHHQIFSHVHMLSGIIREAEEAKLSKSNILEVLKPVRKLYAQSPFIAHLQTWPRGYPGDFEAIEYICENTISACPGTPAFYLEYHALNSIAAQQHRNKIHWQSKCIQEGVLSEQKTRILSIACGSSRDIQEIGESLNNTDVLFFLNDADSNALQYSLCQLESIRSKIKLIPGNVFRSIRSFQTYKPFHRILAGGLFDYLTDRQLEWLIPKLIDLLHVDGVMCFTNIGNGNPDRIFMEYIADWHITERNEADIERIVDNSCDLGKIDLNIERDFTGLTLLVKLKKVSS